MKAGRIFRFDEIQIELCFSLKTAREIEFYQPGHRLWPVSGLFRNLVTGLAGAVNIQQRAAHMVVADLQRAFTLIGHVTIAQATPEWAWMPWLQSSNSGCWALSAGAPLSA